jgi:hypothetical protein
MPHLDFNYRSQAWKFVLAGGALYNNLDYSFTIGSENGTSPIDGGTPGWGGPNYRKQLLILKKFIEGFNFIRMKPDNSVLKVTDGNLSSFQVFTEPGKQYAIYLEKGKSPEFTLQMPDGEYTAEWINVLSGNGEGLCHFKSKNGSVTVECPDLKDDIALRILTK